MSLSIALNNALTGLNVNQQSLSVLSQNIANANTAGYSRQIVTQSAVYLDGQGAGVSVEDVARKVDDYLLKSVRLQSSAIGKMNTVNDYWDRTQLLLGQPGAGNNASSYLTSFFDSVQGLAQSPESVTQRTNVINTAETFTREINNLAQKLQDLRFQADQDISQAVAAVNHDLQAIHDLNGAIGSSNGLGKSTVGLLDTRDALLKDLSQYLDVQTFVKDNGSINLFTGSGISLLDDSLYQIAYDPAASSATFTNNVGLSPIVVHRLDQEGNTVGTVTLVTGGPSEDVTSTITSGTIRGFIDMRDRNLPNMLAQLDQFASRFRDEANAIHNAGTSFPGASSYTGTRAVFGEDFSNWGGSIRIGVLGTDGLPAHSQYDDETSASRALNLDLTKLNTGNGEGNPSVQGIIDEINSYFTPGNRAVVGGLNNIRLASDTTTLPGTPPSFSFDFDLENISAQNSDFFVTGVQVLDSTATDITSTTSTLPSIAINPTGGYVTTADSTTVTINTTALHGLHDGDRVYLSDPGAIDGIPGASFNKFFVISNVTGNSFDISVDTPASVGGSFNVASQTVMPRYAEAVAGEYGRTRDNGTITADLTGNSSSPFYTIKVDVATTDDQGNIKTAQLTYRVTNGVSNVLNNRYSVQGVSGNATMYAPNTSQPLAVAKLVDEDGNELPKSGGVYTNTQRGFLKISAVNSNNVLSVDSLDSFENGRPNGVPPIIGTGRGFSHYFELNNFFKTLDSGTSTDTVTNSAINMQVEQRLLDDPSLLALGKMVQSVSSDPDNPIYTYERNVGDNSVIQRFASLAAGTVSFSAAGGLAPTAQTLGSYIGQIIGTASANAASSQKDKVNAQSLLDGYTQRADAISGVNLDEELANTIIYQNAYTASTRIITVTDELFQTLLETFR